MPSERARSRMVGLSLLTVDRSGPHSLRRQLYVRLLEGISNGLLAPGARLPSTRAVAAALSVSRTTVADVFAQLLAESYLETRHGSGTYVAGGVRGARCGPAQTAWERASQRGRLFANADVANRPQAKRPIPFQPGVPALDAFPFVTWSQLLAKVLRRADGELASYGEAAGYRPLREAVAAHVRARTGIACDTEQVIVVGGSQQALDLICRLVLDPGDEVWLEDPSSSSVRAVFASTGAQIVPVPVDVGGLDVEAGRTLAPRARLAHVTSAHQWPTGVTLTPERGRELLRWAGEADAWIVEEEYDGVFRYDGARPEALASLDAHGRVVWIGSFSVTTFPALRLGYLVSPPGLVDAFTAAKSIADRQSATVEQAALAEFIYDGHYGRHLARMRDLYAERAAGLIDAARNVLGARVDPPAAGLHAVLRLSPEMDDVLLAATCEALGVVARPLSPLYRARGATPALALGFAVADAPGSAAAMQRLADAYRETQRALARMPRAGRDVPG